MSGNDTASTSLYFYAPNKGAPIFFCLAFAVSGIWHLWQCIRFKCFKVTALYPLAGLIFTIGYAFREVGAFHDSDLGIYIASTILVYIAPPLVELANYHILGRVLYYVPYCAPIHPGRTLTTFGLLSAVVEVLNGLGVAWIANQTLPTSYFSTGEAMLKASLILQLVVVALFVLIVAFFQSKCYKAGIRTVKAQKPLWTMYVSAIFILIRCIYRVVENFSVNKNSYQAEADGESVNPLIRYEWFFYVFEAAPMLLNTFLWNFSHPRRSLPEDYRTYIAQDGVTELQGPGWRDTRSFLVTVCDPFGFFDSSGKKEQPFWETNGFNESERIGLSDASTGKENV